MPRSSNKRNGSVVWTSPKDGKQYRFEFELEKHFEAASVLEGSGRVLALSVVANDDASDNDPVSGNKSNKKQKTEKEEEVGYLQSYAIQRNQPYFHSHGDEVTQELHEFTVTLYDARGKTCRVPGTEFAQIPPSAGRMLLIEKIEICHSLRGQDLGINFLHEFLIFVRQNKKDAGVVVMNPWTLSDSYLSMAGNREAARRETDGKSEAECAEIHRANTIKLRRQYSRMGFAVVKNCPKYLDYWFLSMEKYLSVTDPKAKWLTKAEAQQLDIPIKPKEHVDSKEDELLRELLKSIYAKQNNSTTTPMSFIGMTSPTSIGGGSYLTRLAKDHLQRLVRDGASLNGINALHMTAANYKSKDLFEYLTTEHHLRLDEFDENGQLPLHIATACNNDAAVKILLDLGANKNAKNQDGLTAFQLLQEADQDRNDFCNVFGLTKSPPTTTDVQLRQLLR